MKTYVATALNTFAVAETAVLVLGESGTGKKLNARAIHAASKRRYAPLVAVNCGRIPERAFWKVSALASNVPK